MPRTIERGIDVCEHPEHSEDGTTRFADQLVHERGSGQVLKMCDYHAELTMDIAQSEYTMYCSNCGCAHAIN